VPLHTGQAPTLIFSYQKCQEESLKHTKTRLDIEPEGVRWMYSTNPGCVWRNLVGLGDKFCGEELECGVWNSVVGTWNSTGGTG